MKHCPAIKIKNALRIFQSNFRKVIHVQYTLQAAHVWWYVNIKACPCVIEYRLLFKKLDFFSESLVKVYF